MKENESFLFFKIFQKFGTILKTLEHLISPLESKFALQNEETKERTKKANDNVLSAFKEVVLLLGKCLASIFQVFPVRKFIILSFYSFLGIFKQNFRNNSFFPLVSFRSFQNYRPF